MKISKIKYLKYINQKLKKTIQILDNMKTLNVSLQCNSEAINYKALQIYKLFFKLKRARQNTEPLKY